MFKTFKEALEEFKQIFKGRSKTSIFTALSIVTVLALYMI
jgi:hypothetical protein